MENLAAHGLSPTHRKKSLKTKILRTNFVRTLDSNEEFATKASVLVSFGQCVSQPSIEKFYLQQTNTSAEKVQRTKEKQVVIRERDLRIAHTKPQASGIIEEGVSESEAKEQSSGHKRACMCSQGLGQHTQNLWKLQNRSHPAWSGELEMKSHQQLSSQITAFISRDRDSFLSFSL